MLVKKIEAENAAKQNSDACKFLIESGDEKIEYEKDAKIDYKPEFTCAGEPNVDQF